MNELPKILFVSLYDPRDQRAWSGTVHNMARMLEMQGLPVEYMPVLMQNHRLWRKGIERLRSLVLGTKPAPVDRSFDTAIRSANAIEQRLRQSDVDVVFSPSSIPLARLRTPHLKVFHTDATFAGIIHQYPEMATFAKEYIEEGHQIESDALQNCDLAIYSSQWAADSAINYYGADPDKVHVVPFGSNLGIVPARDGVLAAIQARSRRKCELLFIGVHWQRKGGDITLQAARELKAMGFDVRLTIIGCRPPYEDLPDLVNVIPYLDKRKPEGLRQFVEIIKSSHFLILPSMADCTPIVVNECNSFGVPCLTSDVGGLPEMIREGSNGHLFEQGRNGVAYAKCIARYMSDREAYVSLAESSLREHEERLGWNASGRNMLEVIGSALVMRTGTAINGMYS